MKHTIQIAKSVFCLLLAALCLIAMLSAVQAVSYSGAAQVTAGESRVLTVGQGVLFAKSENDAVLSVSSVSGERVTVYGKKKGSTALILTLSDGSEERIGAEVRSALLDEADQTAALAPGAKASYSFYAVDRCQSSDSSVASVWTDGTRLVITAKSEGEARITARKMDSAGALWESFTAAVTVTEGFSDTLTLEAGGTAATESVYCIAALKVADEAIVRVSKDKSGRLIYCALKEGETEVTYRCKQSFESSWIERTVRVTVEGAAQAGGVGFPKEKTTVQLGRRYRIQAGLTVAGEAVKAEALLWSSSDESVLTVEKTTGRFTAVGAGTAWLIAVTKDGSAMGRMRVTVTE